MRWSVWPWTCMGPALAEFVRLPVPWSVRVRACAGAGWACWLTALVSLAVDVYGACSRRVRAFARALVRACGSVCRCGLGLLVDCVGQLGCEARFEGGGARLPRHKGSDSKRALRVVSTAGLRVFRGIWRGSGSSLGSSIRGGCGTPPPTQGQRFKTGVPRGFHSGAKGCQGHLAGQ